MPDSNDELLEAERRVLHLRQERKRKADAAQRDADAAQARANTLRAQVEPDATETVISELRAAAPKRAGSGFRPPVKKSKSISELISVPSSMLSALSAEEPTAATDLVESQVKKAQEVVDFYATIAAGVSFLPSAAGFASVFAVQILMVRDIAAQFGRDLSTQKITTAIAALLGTAFEMGIGSGFQALVWGAFPGSIGGVLGVLVNPVAGYATAQAVGAVFINQFQGDNHQELTKGLAQQVETFKAVFAEQGGTIPARGAA